MARDPEYQGRRFTIVSLEFQDGTCPVGEFLDGLDAKDAAKVGLLFTRLGDHGELRDNEKFKKLKDSNGIFAFKSYQIRILGFFTPGRQFVLVHALRKKDDRYKAKDIRRAEDLRTQYLGGRKK